MDADIPSDGRHRDADLEALARVWASPGAPSLGRLARHAFALPAGQIRWALGRLPGTALDGLSGEGALDPSDALDALKNTARDAATGWLRDQLAALGPAGAELAGLLHDAAGLTPRGLADLLHAEPVLPDPVPAHAVRRTLERHLPGAVTEFDAAPLAVSPLHQTHTGVLRDGQAVFLRVLRPGARSGLRDDLRLAANLVAPLTLLPQAETVQPMAVLRSAARRAAEQTDLRHDARNAAELTELLDGRLKGLRLAEPVLESRGAVAYALPDGAVPLAEADANVRAALPGFLALVVETALADGVFHADLRADHLFALPDGTLLLAGCTTAGRLAPHVRRAFLDYVTALFSGDFAGQVDALGRLGAVPDATDRAALEADLRAAPELSPLRLLRGGGDAAKVLGDLASRHHLRLPSPLLGWARALLTYRALTRHLVPDMPFIQALLPLVPRLGEINRRLTAAESG
ncbi:putative unusual protein kinase regulating ubiquinone biosynthesis (AarF/ABC1/UbiB family) [Actinocorallia herbida]|uniref:Putative unusual protein kinase regulating ubiquinone biosynthesis (AarF/ABC1/UbiB family) n=1 Tax=Actinocorallia herbida TaxID=58109 RepID=A0A3N1D9J7_9ACTN|nr:AarF/UbiB family protein [Actinocorallia herbida]ROO89758.1 putative unusual protein kinase regulating ubiquinone biosynthesis (AarF/ABC1/UbiB family) [Actinocorallia herbida]